MSKSEQDRIVALGQLDWTLRQIEDAVGCRRETAGKYLRLAGIKVRKPGRWGHPSKPAIEASTATSAAPEPAIEASPSPATAPEAAIKVSPGRNPAQTSLCEPYRDEIAAKVQKGVCAKVISEELVGFKGGYASVKRFVRQLKADGGPPAPLVGSIHTERAHEV